VELGSFILKEIAEEALKEASVDDSRFKDCFVKHDEKRKEVVVRHKNQYARRKGVVALTLSVHGDGYVIIRSTKAKPDIVDMQHPDFHEGLKQIIRSLLAIRFHMTAGNESGIAARADIRKYPSLLDKFIKQSEEDIDYER
jgi:hypothetical protein